MRIAIDMSPILFGTGVSVYTKNLVENLIQIDSENEYILFGGSLRRRNEMRQILDHYKDLSPKVMTKIFPLPPTVGSLIWNRLHIIAIEKLIGTVDVFHSSDWTQPPSGAFKVTTIHDLAPLMFPKLMHPRIVDAHKMRLKWVLREVDRVVVPSETTASDVIAMGYDRSKIRVVSEGVDKGFKQSDKSDIERVKRKFRIYGKYLLAVGVNQRKNTQRIIEAFERLKAELNLKLVIVGHPYEEIRSTRGVIFTRHVDQSDMPALFSGSEALVYPSLYEGFGIPILEAFATCVPVVTSKIGAMKEIAQNSAVLVDPYNVSSISEGIRKSIKIKKRLVSNGIKELRKYSWQLAARKTLEVYKESVN